MVPVADDFGYFFDMIGRSVQLKCSSGVRLRYRFLPRQLRRYPLALFSPSMELLSFLFTAHNADIHPGILEVVAQLDPGDGYEADTGILQTMLNQFGDFLMDQFLNSL